MYSILENISAVHFEPFLFTSVVAVRLYSVVPIQPAARS